MAKMSNLGVTALAVFIFMFIALCFVWYSANDDFSSYLQNYATEYAKYLTNSNGDDTIDINETELEPMIDGLQCYSQYQRNNILNYGDLTANYCVYNYTTDCKMERAQNILFPSQSKSGTNKELRALQEIQKLTYLVVGHHGGVQMDVLSFLYHKLRIISKNIYNICIGSYCEFLDETISQIYWNKEKSDKIIETVGKSNRMYKTGYGPCCFRSSMDIITNINKTQKFRNYLKSEFVQIVPEIIDQKWDVMICLFPGVQCIGWLPFAKSIIFRFAHRYDHHLWNPENAKVKWIKILNMMIGYCRNRNINMFVTNIYDYYYFKHTIHSKDDNVPYLWPNFALQFIDEFGRNSTETPLNRNQHNFYVFADSKAGAKCRKNYLNMTQLTNKLKLEQNIHVELNYTVSKSFMYNSSNLHLTINGFIIIPYAVHTAKWSEYYSIGIPLFLPSLQFWEELNRNCFVVTDRQHGNKPERRFKKEAHKELYEFMAYSPCCGTDPYTNYHQDVWLPFSDWYNDKLFKYVIYYDNETDLEDKVINHHKDLEFNKTKILQRKMKQINEWQEMSDMFKYQIADVIFKGHLASFNENCIPYVINSTDCIRKMNPSELDRPKASNISTS